MMTSACSALQLLWLYPSKTATVSVGLAYWVCAWRFSDETYSSKVPKTSWHGAATRAYRECPRRAPLARTGRERAGRLLRQARSVMVERGRRWRRAPRRRRPRGPAGRRPRTGLPTHPCSGQTARHGGRPCSTALLQRRDRAAASSRYQLPGGGRLALGSSTEQCRKVDKRASLEIRGEKVARIRP
jgi:hypothetical protein